MMTMTSVHPTWSADHQGSSIMLNHTLACLLCMTRLTHCIVTLGKLMTQRCISIKDAAMIDRDYRCCSCFLSHYNKV